MDKRNFIRAVRKHYGPTRRGCPSAWRLARFWEDYVAENDATPTVQSWYLAPIMEPDHD